MMKTKSFLICSMLVLMSTSILQSCGNSKSKKPNVPYVSYSDEEDEIFESGDIVTVPFRDNGGVKTIRVSLNGVEVDMIFDTGCSGTLISLAEAQYLYTKGLLTEDDFLGSTQATIADGSIVENMVIRLDCIVIADKLACRNVEATVSPNTEAPLLLGNEVLNRAASYTIDNQNKVIKFKLN